MLQLQTMTADHHLRIATLEKEQNIDLRKDIDDLKEKSTELQARANQQCNRILELGKMDGKLQYLQEQIKILDVQHSYLALRIENLDIMVDKALNLPRPEPATVELPEKKRK